MQSEPKSFDVADIYAWATRCASDQTLRASVDFAVIANELARLPAGQHVYDDPYLIVQLSTGAQGYAFVHPNELDQRLFSDIVGRRVADIAPPPSNALMTALADAIGQERRPAPLLEIELKGTSQKKSSVRADTIRSLVPDGDRVAVIGGIEDIVRSMLAARRQIRVADLHLAGQELAGVPVEHDYREVLAWADSALITGNVLKTNTLGDVAQIVRAGNVRVTVYSMTGHNIFPQIMDRIGFEAVTCETFPFYWFADTPSILRVYKSNANLNPRV